MVKDVRECEMVRDRNVLANATNNRLTSPSDHGVETPMSCQNAWSMFLRCSRHEHINKGDESGIQIRSLRLEITDGCASENYAVGVMAQLLEAGSDGKR
jgi:hypothetical protein